MNLDCSNLSSLKDFTFIIEGKKFVIDKEFYIMKINEEVMKQELGFLRDNNSNAEEIKCINAFMNLDAIHDPEKIRFVLGGPFIKKYYSVFDRENKKIGLALANHIS